MFCLIFQFFLKYFLKTIFKNTDKNNIGPGRYGPRFKVDWAGPGRSGPNFSWAGPLRPKVSVWPGRPEDQPLSRLINSVVMNSSCVFIQKQYETIDFSKIKLGSHDQFIVHMKNFLGFTLVLNETQYFNQSQP